MPKLYNTQTRKAEAVPEDQINQAIAAGTHAYKKGEKINVRDSSGQTFSLDAAELPEALKSGEYSIEAPRQTAVREYVEDNDNLKGMAKVALGQFADEALMNIPELIYEKKGDPLDVAKWEGLKKEHAFTNAAAGVGGFGTSLLYGGPVGKTAALAARAGEKAVASRLVAAGLEAGSKSVAKELAKKVAKGAVQMGVEGATYAAPVAITEAMLGDPELAAETLLIGGGAGAAFGAAAAPVKELFKLGASARAAKALEDAGESSWLQNFKNERGAKALGFSKGQINKLRGGQKEATGIAEDVLNMRTADGQKIIGAMDSAEKIADNISRVKSETGEQIGQIYKKVDDSGIVAFQPQKVKERIKSELGDFYRSALNKDEATLFDNLLETVAPNSGGNIASSRLTKEEMKSFGAFFGDKAGKDGIPLLKAKEILDIVDRTAFPGGKRPINPTPKQELAYNARKIIRDEINKAADEGAKALGDPTTLERLKAANKQYGTIMKAEKAIKDRVSSEQGNKIFGLTDVIAGGSIGAVNPVAAMATVAAKKFAEKYGNQILANVDGLLFAEQAMKRTAKAMDAIPEKLKNMLNGTGKVKASTSAVGAIGRFLGNEDYKKSKMKAFEDLSQSLAEVNANPAYATDKVSQMTEGLSNGGAPQTADHFTAKQVLISKYLQDHMPRAMNMSTPFKQVKWKPTDFELSQIERRIHALQDPLSVIDDLQKGTLSPEAVDAVRTVYPKLFVKMQERITQYFMDNPTTVPYSQRIKLSLLLGTTLDNDLQPQNILNLQKTFVDEAQAQQQTMASNKPLDLPSMQTDTQAVSFK